MWSQSGSRPGDRGAALRHNPLACPATACAGGFALPRGTRLLFCCPPGPNTVVAAGATGRRLAEQPPARVRATSMPGPTRIGCCNWPQQRSTPMSAPGPWRIGLVVGAGRVCALPHQGNPRQQPTRVNRVPRCARCGDAGTLHRGTLVTRVAWDAAQYATVRSKLHARPLRPQCPRYDARCGAQTGPGARSRRPVPSTSS